MNLSELLSVYSPLLRKLLKESQGIEYRALFLEPQVASINADNARSSIGEIRFIYILGIIERAHLACMTSIARNLQWLEAANNAVIQKNALSFSASLRGYLESSADAHDVMKHLPTSLAKLAPYIYLVFAESKEVENIMVAPKELEERLIHYAYAKRQPKGSHPPPNHTNKSNAEYIREFETFGVIKAQLLYAELCELTHPAASSVSCFLDEGSDSIKFNSNKDEQVIADLLSRYESTIEGLTMFSLNPALISLSFLHRLSSHWPAPSDQDIQPIGNALTKLLAFDKFVADYDKGVFDLPNFLKGLQ